MGSISVACYKPRTGKEEALLELVRNHLPPLRAEGLVTDRIPIVMRTESGTIIEIFEWVSKEAIAGAPLQSGRPRSVETLRSDMLVRNAREPARVPEHVRSL
jgi:hypothetical protein